LPKAREDLSSRTLMRQKAAAAVGLSDGALIGYFVFAPTT
jgi:hypothetical protein